MEVAVGFPHEKPFAVRVKRHRIYEKVHSVCGVQRNFVCKVGKLGDELCLTRFVLAEVFRRLLVNRRDVVIEVFEANVDLLIYVVDGCDVIHEIGNFCEAHRIAVEEFNPRTKGSSNVVIHERAGRRGDLKRHHVIHFCVELHNYFF